MTAIAFIGGGLAVRDLHVPALESLGLLDRVSRVATSSDSSSEAAAEWLQARGAAGCRASSVDDLLADPEVGLVLVAVPIEMTERTAQRVVDAGKPLLVEKPIATSTTAALKLSAAARERQVPLLAGENFRFKPEFARMRQLASSGAIGDVKVIYWNDLHFTPPTGKYAETEWRIAGAHQGGYLVDGGTHIVAGLRQLTDSAIVSVHAVSAASQAYLSHQQDTLLMNLVYDDGVIGHLALGYGVHDPEARHPKICGTSGTLALMNDAIYLVNQDGVSKLEDREGGAGFDHEWSLLQSAASGDKDASNLVHELTMESIRDLQLLERAFESSRHGKQVELSAL